MWCRYCHKSRQTYEKGMSRSVPIAAVPGWKIGFRWGFFAIIARTENKPLKQLFHIENSDSHNGPLLLSLKLGEKHAGFAITDKTGKVLQQLAWCTIDDPEAEGWNEKELTDFFGAYPRLDHSFNEVRMAYDFPQTILVPSVGTKEEEAGLLLTSSGYPCVAEGIVSELVSGWQLRTIYAVPAEIREWVNRKFPAATTRHQYALDVANIDPAGEKGSLTVDLRKEDFTVVAAKGPVLLLAQTYHYSTPPDILYYLLKICREFSLSQEELHLQLSGLIDKRSSLYNELYQYFINISFREADWDTGSEYPSHFFTSLNDLATCAS